jgi:hypothetical protein
MSTGHEIKAKAKSKNKNKYYRVSVASTKQTIALRSTILNHNIFQS